MQATDVISLVKAKAFLKVDFADEDEIITDCIKSAVAMVEDYTSYRLYQREETVTSGLCEVQLFQTPINAITSIQDQTNQDIDVTSYTVEKWAVRTVFKFGYHHKFVGDLSGVQEPLRSIKLDVGFSTAESIPQSLMAALKQLIVFLYENRNETKVELPDNIMMALNRNNRAPLL